VFIIVIEIDVLMGVKVRILFANKTPAQKIFSEK